MTSQLSRVAMSNSIFVFATFLMTQDKSTFSYQYDKFYILGYHFSHCFDIF